MAETVKTLSAVAQRKSLGATSKKEKAHRKPIRTTVINPREIEWPDVGEEGTSELVALIERSMKILTIRCRHVPLNKIRTVPATDRSEFRKKWVAEETIKTGYDISKYTLLRSTISMGVNSVSKAMELDQLEGVIIEKNVDPEIITKLLIPIANSKGVPIISLTGLQPAFKKVTGMRCIALGFKKPCSDITHEFYKLLQAVKQYSAKLNANYDEEETMLVSNIPDQSQQQSNSLTSSQEGQESNKQQMPFEQKIENLTRNVKAIRKALPNIAASSGYIPPKIRKMNPNQ